MANPDHLAILKKGVAAWNRWRNNGLPPIETAPDLCNADLRAADLRKANLACAHFESADLRDARLDEADLRAARLLNADLSGANLTSARMQNLQSLDINLKAANLHNADLSGAVLLRADLRGADLSIADLNQAFLSTANLEKAIFYYTRVTNLDLSEVIGLNTAVHLGPSTIGIDTFFLSKGKIPEVFLRGAGVPEELIRHMTSFHVNPIQFFSCFISYSHADKAFARRLHDALQGRGIRCWLDEKHLLPGDHIHRDVDEAVRLWDKVLLCCSKDSLTSWWVDKEVSKALKKEEQLWKERSKQVLAIIPLNLDGYMFDANWQDWKKQHLTDRLAADFKEWETDSAKFESQLQLVVKGLRADSGAREQPPKPKL